MNTQENKDWVEEVHKKLVALWEHPEEFQRAVRTALQQAQEREEQKWRKILNSGRKMYELGKKDERERIREVWEEVKDNMDAPTGGIRYTTQTDCKKMDDALDNKEE